MQITNVKREVISEIFVPKSIVNIKSDSIRIFALDAKTIGLSNQPPDFWPKACLWEGRTTVVDDEDHYSILFPNEIVNFYNPRTIDLSGDIDHTRLLVVLNDSHRKSSASALPKKSVKSRSR